MRVLLNVPKTARKGEAIEIKVLISHAMESGQRRDEMGKLVPRQIIHDFRCTYNGAEVLSLQLFPAIAANPSSPSPPASRKAARSNSTGPTMPG